MILLDPDLDPESPHGQRPVRGKPGPASTTLSAKPPAASIQDKNHRLPSARTLARFLIQAQAALRLKGQVTVLLTTDAYLRKLNRQFRGKNKATDVLSFLAISIPGIKGAEALAGDLAISVPTALRQAVDQGHSLSTEIKILILHGLLHLAGYDHEADDGKMARRERQLRARLNLPQGLIERAVNPVSQKSVILSDRSAAEGVEGPAVRSAKQRIKLRVPQVPILGPGKPQTPPRKRGQKP
jgi:probable rRNA maturation factor